MRRFWISDFGFGIGHRVGFKAKGARSILTSRFPPSTERKSAFTLVELMGVMAIIGILAAVTLPSLISRIEDANTTKEDANLEEIARALVAGIKATGMIPNPTTPNFDPGSWTAIALNYTTLGQTALASVLPANNDRQIILSANLAAYVTANVNSYATDADGWPDPLPNDLKIYILASSKNGLPLQANIPVVDIANWTKVFNAGTGTVAVPASVFGAANTTKGEFLHVKVVDLNQLFCRVELIDTAAPEDIAGFNITVAGAGYTPSSSVMVAYLNNNITFRTLPADLFNLADDIIIVNGIWDTGEAYTDVNVDGAYNNTGALNNTVIPTLSLASSYNARHAAIPNTVIQPGTAQYAGPASPNPPTYDLIAAVGPGAGDFLPSPDPAPPAGLGADHNQTQTFYVLKGQAINLFNGAPALDKSVVIQSDVQYKYYNNSWTRVD